MCTYKPFMSRMRLSASSHHHVGPRDPLRRISVTRDAGAGLDRHHRGVAQAGPLILAKRLVTLPIGHHFDLRSRVRPLRHLPRFQPICEYFYQPVGFIIPNLLCSSTSRLIGLFSSSHSPHSPTSAHISPFRSFRLPDQKSTMSSSCSSKPTSYGGSSLHFRLGGS